MKLNYFMKWLPSIGRWVATTLLCVVAIAVVWQGAFFSNPSAMAAPTPTLIANAGNQAKGKASEDAGRTKNFVRDATDQVKRTANQNADRVGQATDSNGSFVERKARRDAARIEQRADQDSARTQQAIDKTKNAVQRTVDNVKNAFN